MKKLITIIILPFAVYCKDVTLAVLPFDAAGISKNEAIILTDRLSTEFFKLEAFIVIERSKMDDVLNEQGFQQTGCTTSECAVEVGNLLGVQKMVTGTVGKFGSLYTVSSRLVDVESGKIERQVSKDIQGTIEMLLLKTMAEIAADLSGINKKSTDNETNSTEITNKLSDCETYINQSEKRPVRFIPYDDPPKPLTPIRPLYPKHEQENGIEGTVIVRAFVNDLGCVESTSVLKGIPNSGLDDYALYAIRKTKFRPANYRGHPVGVWISIPVNFKLQ